jgi:hypothetical protein
MFVASPEVVASICMGAVNDGVKFCTLGTNSRSYSTHEKKVPIKPSHIYIASINKVSLKLSFPSHEYLLQEAANCTYFRDPTTWGMDSAVPFSSIIPEPLDIKSVVTPQKKTLRLVWGWERVRSPFLFDPGFFSIAANTVDFEVLLHTKVFFPL